MHRKVLLQTDEVVLPCPNDVHFDLHAMWNIGVFEVLSKEEEETSKLLAFEYV